MYHLKQIMAQILNLSIEQKYLEKTYLPLKLFVHTRHNP